MNKIRVIFYKLSIEENLINNIGLLCNKLISSGEKIAILCQLEMINELDDKLWTFSQNIFLPHGIWSNLNEFARIKTSVLLYDNIKNINEKILILYGNDEFIQNCLKENLDVFKDIIIMNYNDIAIELSNNFEISRFEKKDNKWIKL